MNKKRSFVSVDVAMNLLRPGARYQLTNQHFTLWDDPRPVPTWQEIVDTIEKMQAFEDSINTLYLEDYPK
jgi:hypothetical protein